MKETTGHVGLILERKCPPAVLRLIHSGLKVRAQYFSCLFALFRLLLVVKTIFTTRTQDEPKMVLAATHTAAAGDGRRSPFVVQVEPKTLGEVRDHERKVV